MPNVKVSVNVEVDGKSISGFPIVRRLTVDELQQFNYEEAADNDTVTFSALPAGELAEIQMLLARADIPITLRLDGQTDAGIVLNAGGLLLIIDGDIDAGAGVNNASVNNPHASQAAVVQGIAAGT